MNPIDTSNPSPAEVLALNVAYWNWWTQFTNRNILNDWNVKVASWQSNFGYFHSKGIADPPPPKPLVWSFDETTFRQEWADSVESDNPSKPTARSAFSQSLASVPDPQPPSNELPHPPAPVGPPVLGPQIGPGKFNKAPGDQSLPGRLITVDGQDYVLVGDPTPFGIEDYWQMTASNR